MEKHLFRLFAVMMCLALSGCKYTAFTHEGAVKATTNDFFGYLDKSQWNGAKELMDPAKFTYYTSSGSAYSSGSASQEAFIQSVQTISGLRSIYCKIHSAKRLKNGNITVNLTAIGSVVENSTTMSYSQIEWKANFVWSKKDAVRWQLRTIRDLTVRRKGNPS